MSLMTIPWLLAVATGIWFGLMARRAGRNWLLWGLGGALFALVSSTILFGLGEASAIPFSDADRASLHRKWTAAAVVMIAVLGWLFTLPLQRGNFTQLKPADRPALTPAPTVPASRIESKPEVPKPGAPKP